MAKSPSTSKEGSPKDARVVLVDFTDKDERPDIAIYAVDRAYKVIGRARISEDGSFDLPERSLKEADYVVVGRFDEKAERLSREGLVQFRSAQFAKLIEAEGLIEIARAKWLYWLRVRVCVNGSVWHCWPFPWLIDRFALAAVKQQSIRVSPAALQAGEVAHVESHAMGAAARLSAINLSDAAIAKSLPEPILPHRCDIICDGVIEVYRRTCCCPPWIIDDPRIPDLVDILDHLPPWPPEFKWPPRPEPDPPPILESIFREGTLDETIVNAHIDLAALRSLPAADKLAYIQARPHLFCLLHCGPAVKVAEGFIQPDGEFHICWWEPIRLLLPYCHDEYSFVVKQNKGGSIITIYNGPAANKWFRYGQEMKLVSYHPKAQGCRHNDFPGDGAFALLQDIGSTGSYNLKTPNQTGWDRVGAPAYNDGLAFPAASAMAAQGQYLDRNWGGTLALRYHFSEDMRTAGARYYRIGVIAADPTGAPTGSRTYLSDGLSWLKYISGGDVVPVVLGPNSPGGTANLFLIPYDTGPSADPAVADWQSGQYHGYLKTTDFPEGRYLLTLEVFDAGGQRLRPTGAAGPGTDTAFTFRRWFQPVGPTANVPFAALTHMLWWDNRQARAIIADLRQDGVASSSECQFLVGDNTAQFSAGYHAFHPNAMFQLNHSMWWRRGLGGPWGYLVSANPNNVGAFGPPDPPGVSGSASFLTMLDGHRKCSFSLNLQVNVKTFNGSGTLNSLDASDQAAFALERTGP